MQRIRERALLNKCTTCETATAEEANDANCARLQCGSCRGKIARQLAELTAPKQAEVLRQLLRDGFLILPHELKRLRAKSSSTVQRIFDKAAG